MGRRTPSHLDAAPAGPGPEDGTDRMIQAGTSPRIRAVPLLASTTNGVVYPQSATRLSSIVDGTSNTMIFGERAHGILGGEDAATFYFWNSGWWGNTAAGEDVGRASLPASRGRLRPSSPSPATRLPRLCEAL